MRTYIHQNAQKMIPLHIMKPDLYFSTTLSQKCQKLINNYVKTSVEMNLKNYGNFKKKNKSLGNDDIT